jgi:hypothetical protein
MERLRDACGRERVTSVGLLVGQLLLAVGLLTLILQAHIFAKQKALQAHRYYTTSAAAHASDRKA